MQRRHQGVLVVFAMVMACSGCALWKSSRKQPYYETLAANPNYDTDKAEQLHAKALKHLETTEGETAHQLASAENLLQQALVADVTYGPAHNSLGVLYVRQRNFYLAAWEFEYAARMMPERIEPLYNLGQLYEDAGRLDQALDYYEQAMVLAPRDPTVVASLTSVQLKNGQSVDELRPYLEMIVFGDNRPEWIEWARDQLGRHPLPVVTEASATQEVPPAPVPNSAPRFIPPPPVPKTSETLPRIIPEDLPDFPKVPTAPPRLPLSPPPVSQPTSSSLEQLPGRASI